MSGGRSRNVKVTAVKASEIPGGDFTGFRYGTGENGGMRMFGPGSNGSVRIIRPQGGEMNFDTDVHVMPRIKINRGGEDDFRFELEQGLKGLRELGPQIRKEIERAMPSKVTVRSVNRAIL